MSRFLSPVIADILKSTPLFGSIKDYVYDAVFKTGAEAENNIIEGLGIPEFLKTAILDNNNSVVYDKFNVVNPKDYVSEYIANFVVNIIAMILVFVLSGIIENKYLLLNVFSKLPIIKTANKFGGGALGLAQGIIIVWIGLAVLTMLYGKPMFNGANEAVANSLIASKFYDSNILIKGLSAISNLI